MKTEGKHSTVNTKFKAVKTPLKNLNEICYFYTVTVVCRGTLGFSLITFEPLKIFE